MTPAALDALAARLPEPPASIANRLDYEFEWKIINRCNYRCSYCFFDGKWEYVTPLDRFFPISSWIEAWLRIYERHGPARIIVTGGEPTYYPNFIELFRVLTRYHRMSFDTNLSRKRPWVEEFAANVRPDRVYIGISFHPEFADLEDFISKARVLRDAGFDYKIHLICYPPLLPSLPDRYRRLVAEGFSVLPGPFRGHLNGRDYPEAYTAEERAAIEAMTGDLSDKYRFWVAQQMNPIVPRGKLCLAGHRYARVECDGAVWRCNQYLQNDEPPMGSFFDPAFRLEPAPTPCASDRCGCEWWWLVELNERRHRA